MAKPDLDDGWFMLAYELVAALMVAQIPKEARIVLFEVLSQLYGPSKRESARLSPTEIAERTGLAKPNVARGVAFLLKNGVLDRDGLHDYTFVKDYEAWGTPGDPLVPAKLADYAVKVPKRLKLEGECKGPKPGRKRVIETDNRSKDASVDNPLTDVDRLSKNDDFVIHLDNAPPISENREVVVVVEDEPATGSDSRPVIETDNASKKANDPAIWSQRPFKHDPTDVARVKEQVEALNPMAFLGQKVENLKSAYPLDWILKAFVRAAGQSDGNLAAYANTLLIAAWQRGHWIDVEDFAAPSARDPRPSPPPRQSAFQAKQERLRAFLKSGKAVPRDPQEDS